MTSYTHNLTVNTDVVLLETRENPNTHKRVAAKWTRRGKPITGQWVQEAMQENEATLVDWEKNGRSP